LALFLTGLSILKFFI